MKKAKALAAHGHVVITASEFGNLFAAWRARFEAVAYRYVRNRSAVEDIISDSFMAFWENRNQIPAEVNIQAYILTIVRNKSLDWLRSQSLHQKIEQDVYSLRQRILAADIRSLGALDPADLFSGEVGTIVEQTLERLPELTRMVFTDRRFNGLSYKEISEKYDISVRRVEFELEKATKHLRVALKDYLSVLLFLLADAIMQY